MRTFPLGTLLEVLFNTSAYSLLSKHVTTPNHKDPGKGSFHSGPPFVQLNTDSITKAEGGMGSG